MGGFLSFNQVPEVSILMIYIGTRTLTTSSRQFRAFLSTKLISVNVYEYLILDNAKNSALMEMQDYAVHKLVSNALLPAQNVILTVSEN